MYVEYFHLVQKTSRAELSTEQISHIVQQRDRYYVLSSDQKDEDSSIFHLAEYTEIMPCMASLRNAIMCRFVQSSYIKDIKCYTE